MKRLMWILPVLLTCACAKEGDKHDLGKVITGARTGMTELALTQAIGAPTTIEVVNGVRELRYDGKDGGYVIVAVKGNIVTDIRPH